MRILLVHAKYQRPGGEDTVFANELRLLEKYGHTVETFVVDNMEIENYSISERFMLAISTTWSAKYAHKVSEAAKRFQADIVHVHNTFPLISPSIFHSLKKHRITTVCTLHNYRIACSNALLMRQGKICNLCVDGHFFNGVVHRCYRNSFSASSAVVASQYVHRYLGTYSRTVDKVIALTEFAKAMLIRCGIPDSQITIKPNFVFPTEKIATTTRDYAVFVGRLSEEKGIQILLKAWQKIEGIPLKIVGDGPLRDHVINESERSPHKIQYLGQVPHDQVTRIIADAMFLIIPSTWYEGLPMTVIESYSVGTPVLASKIGGLAEIVIPNQTGEHFLPANSTSIVDAVHRFSLDVASLDNRRKTCLSHYENHYSPEVNISILESIYSSARSHAVR